MIVVTTAAARVATIMASTPPWFGVPPAAATMSAVIVAATGKEATANPHSPDLVSLVMYVPSARTPDLGRTPPLFWVL